MRWMRLFLIAGALGACRSACEQAADYRFDCGQPPFFEPEPRCGARTDAACEAECDLQADCIVFDPPRTIADGETLAALTAANRAWEDCLATCVGD